MIKNFFTIAVRNIWKHKIFTMINVAGLAIGISAALVIYLIIDYDLGFDKFESDGNRIYRVVTEIKFPGLEIRNQGVPAPLPRTLKLGTAGVEAVAGFQQANEINVKVPVIGNTVPKEFRKQKYAIYTDEEYFKLIKYEWIAGNPSVLKEPNTCVLAQSKAELYFPGANPSSIIGQTILYDDSINMTIKGVVKDIKEKTDFVFTEFLSMSTIANSNMKENYGWDQWSSINSSSQLYLTLSPGTKPEQVMKAIAAVTKAHSKEGDMEKHHKLQPLSELHFGGDYANYTRTAHKPTLMGLALVAIFLLVLACINFINLSTAQSGSRAREIGIRKTLGSSKAQLVFQFLGETLVVTLIAAALSLTISPFILKIFSDFIPDGIQLSIGGRPGILIFLIALILVITILSGLYPSLVLSRFQPVEVLKGQSSGSKGSHRLWLRKSLTVSQFIIAQFLVISTFIVVKQIRFSLNKDMGFNREAIINFQAPWNIPDSAKRVALLSKINAIPEVQQAVLAGSAPANEGYNTTTMSYTRDKKKYEMMIEVKSGDSNYFKLYKMKLLAGRFAIPSSNDGEIVINQTFASDIGFKNPSDAIGISIIKNDKPTLVVGVLADFHAQSVHSKIKPLSYSADSRGSMYHIKLFTGKSREGKWADAIKKMEVAWKETYPKDDFEYSFLDENISKFYKSEQNMSKLLTWSTGLCIFISCLGLMGLVMHATQQRIKEIGVRKVLGASIRQIISLLSTDFIKLVILAFIIASPLAWWTMSSWLNNFAYRTQLNWWVFVVSGLVMLLAAVATMGILTFRAANANPVKSLRTE